MSAGDLLAAIGDMPARNLTEIKLALIEYADTLAIRYRPAAAPGDGRTILVIPLRPDASAHGRLS